MSEKGFLKENTIKQHVKDTYEFRSSKEAVDLFIQTMDKQIEEHLKKCFDLANKEKRKTIMEEDVKEVFKNVIVEKKELSWEEVAEELIKKNPTDLGQISKRINEFLNKN
jgi:histone H3/H4